MAVPALPEASPSGASAWVRRTGWGWGRCGVGAALLAIIGSALALTGALGTNATAAGASSASGSGDARDARAMAVLQQRCVACHNAEKHKGGLRLDEAAALRAGGDNGAVVVAGRPGESRLIQVLAPGADPHMPPKEQLSGDEVRILERWVKAGAAWNAEALQAAAERVEPVRLEPLPPGYHPALAVAWTRDGRRWAVSRGAGVAVQAFASTNAASTNVAVHARWDAHGEGVQALAWDGVGRRLASGGFRRLAWWEPAVVAVTNGAASGASGASSAGGEPSVRRLGELTNGWVGRLTAMTFAAVGGGDGVWVVADSVEGQRGLVRLVDVATGRITASWEAHADAILGMDVSVDGKRLATAGGDKWIKIWDLETRRELARLEGHAMAVTGVAFNSNATQVVSGSADREVKVWDIRTREKIINLARQSAPVTAVRWLAGDGGIVTANESGQIYRYTDLKAHSGEQSSAGGTERKVVDAGGWVMSLGVSEAGGLVLAGMDDGRWGAWRLDGRVRAMGGDAALGAGGTNDSSGAIAAAPLSFVRDVLPVLSKAGCNAGACHAKPEGQAGFKLSVFSYDPAADHAEMVKEARGRRVFPAAPERSLLLRKPSLAVPHEGGERLKAGSPGYELVARWIREGMRYQAPGEPALAGIDVSPATGRYRKGGEASLRVVARYGDGTTRDVTALATFESNDKELAAVDGGGRVKVGRLTGQGVIVARYMGFVADAKVTVPADRLLPAARYQGLPVNNFIDAAAYAQFQSLGLYPSGPCSDEEFLRRSSLDAIGVLPSPEEVRAWVGPGAGPMDTARRRAWIDRLLAHPAYADYWANKFADLLRPNPDRVGVKSVFVLDQWLRESFRANKPYDQLVREVLTAEGSNHRDGPAVVYRDRREPAELTTLFSQIFLGVRLECAKCHHHPNEKWSQDDFYQLAAYFGPLKQKGAGLSPPISAGTETFYFAPGGSVKHPVTGVVLAPKPPDGPRPDVGSAEDPRRALARWLTDPENPFFAKAIVNRVWAAFFGRGMVEPVDDFRISNPCSNPALLDALARDFVRHGCDLKHLMRTVMESHLYQLSSEPNETNLADTRQFSRSYRRRLPAEVLLDAVNDATGVPDTGPAMAPGSRSTQLWSYKIDSQFLDAFGRPNPSTDCPCERDLRTSVVQSLHLMHSRNLQAKLASEAGRVRRLAAGERTPEEIVVELYLATLSRYPTRDELAKAAAAFAAPGATRQTATEDVLWALLNSASFVFNH